MSCAAPNAGASHEGRDARAAERGAAQLRIHLVRKTSGAVGPDGNRSMAHFSTGEQIRDLFMTTDLLAPPTDLPELAQIISADAGKAMRPRASPRSTRRPAANWSACRSARGKLRAGLSRMPRPRNLHGHAVRLGTAPRCAPRSVTRLRSRPTTSRTSCRWNRARLWRKPPPR